MSDALAPIELPEPPASSLTLPPAALLPRRRGRPPGRKSVIGPDAPPLRLHHFQFLRAALELPLRAAWQRYLAFAGGPDDERHMKAQRRALASRVRQAAEARGLQRLADTGLAGHPDRSKAPAPTDPTRLESAAAPPAPALPSLEDWIAERCEALGIDADFQSQAEWLAEYRGEFALDRQPAPARATALTAPPASPVLDAPSLKEQLNALHRLAAELARAPELADALGNWLSAPLCRALQTQGVLSLGDLIDFLNLNHYRWHERVRGIGRDRAERIGAWLAPVAEQLGRPLRLEARHSRTALTLARNTALATLDAASTRRFGLLPLERLAVPPELSGRTGIFRLLQPNVFGAEDDLGAIQKWLQRHAMSPRTFEAYGREVERFYLWCLREAKKPLSSVVEGDLHAYREFLARPPTDWVQQHQADRASDDWRPFRGPLSPISQRRALTVISSMLGALVEGGYLSANAARGVVPFVKLPRTSIDIRRSFTEQQWRWILRTLDSQGDTPFTRRTRLILELGATSGLRLIEMATARIGALRQELIDGRFYWMLDVVGKGNRRRRVPIQDDIKALIDRHQQDMAAAGIGFDPQVQHLRTLLSSPLADPGFSPPDGGTGAGAPDPGQRPLIGALRKPPPCWRLDERGVQVLDRQSSRQSDRYGALEPSARYQSLKRLFRLAARRAELEAGDMAGQQDLSPEIDAAALQRASTHWLRHFFANNAAADGVLPVVLMGAMGHADLRTTSLYTRAEERLMVSELSKVRRRL